MVMVTVTIGIVFLLLTCTFGCGEFYEVFRMCADRL
jgi:hypothetical protein